jgi:hypothetical protein
MLEDNITLLERLDMNVMEIHEIIHNTNFKLPNRVMCDRIVNKNMFFTIVVESNTWIGRSVTSRR